MGDEDFRYFSAHIPAGGKGELTPWITRSAGGRLLRTIAADPDARLRTIAAACRLTERVVHAVIADLEQADYLHRQRVGRCNRYALDLGQPMRHPVEAHPTFRALVDLFADHEAEMVSFFQPAGAD